MFVSEKKEKKKGEHQKEEDEDRVRDLLNKRLLLSWFERSISRLLVVPME